MSDQGNRAGALGKVLNIFDFDGTLFSSPMPSASLWDNNTFGKLREKPTRIPNSSASPSNSTASTTTITTITQTMESFSISDNNNRHQEKRTTETNTTVIRENGQGTVSVETTSNTTVNGHTSEAHFKFTGLGWFQERDSLDEPFVPRQPPLHWYSQDILSKAKESMADENAVTVLLTGRTISYLDIIQSIVEHAGLKFDEYGLKTDPDMATLEFKTQVIGNLFKKYNANRVVIYEDRPKHTVALQKFLDENHIEGKVIQVPAIETILPPELELELVQRLCQKNIRAAWHLKSVVSYTAVVLNEESHAKLVQTIPAPGNDWDIKAHHMTMKLGGIDFNNEEEKQFFLGLTNNNNNSSASPDQSPSVTAPRIIISTTTNSNNNNNDNNNNNSNNDEERSKVIGKKVILRVVAVGLSDKAMAVQVEGVDDLSEVPMRTRNKIPHITIAVSPIGKPKDSNMIGNWEDVRNDPTKSITLEGRVEEVKYYSIEIPSLSKKPPTPSNSPNAKATKFPLGPWVKKHHPQLPGKFVGDAVKKISNWMRENNVDNEEHVENYIKATKFDN